MNIKTYQIPLEIVWSMEEELQDTGKGRTGGSVVGARIGGGTRDLNMLLCPANFTTRIPHRRHPFVLC